MPELDTTERARRKTDTITRTKLRLFNRGSSRSEEQTKTGNSTLPKQENMRSYKH